MLLVGTPWVSGADHAADDDHGAAAKYFFEEVLSLLKKHCYECHSHQADAAEAARGLVLDSRAGWQRGGDSNGGEINYAHAVHHGQEGA